MYFLYITKRLDFLIILKVLISFNFTKLPLIQTLSNAFSILDIKTTVAIDNSRNKLRLTSFFFNLSKLTIFTLFKTPFVFQWNAILIYF